MDIRERDVEDLFYKYGRIRDIDLKTPNRYLNPVKLTVFLINAQQVPEP